jgi:hypothetical protein
MATRRKPVTITRSVQDLIDTLGDDITAGQKAFAAMALALAAELDAGAGLATAGINKELRETIKAMTTEGGGDDGDPRAQQLFAALSAPLVHGQN